MPHTPGPWRANGCELIGSSTVIATLHWHSGRSEENEGDARLIEAAPEMLERLRDLEMLLRGTGFHNSIEAAAARKIISRICAP